MKQHRTSLYKWQKRWFTTENPNDPSQNKVEEGDWAVMDAGPQYAAQPVRNPWWLKEVTRIEEEWYAAFTVAELGEMLVWIEKKRKRYIPFTYQFVGKEGFRCDLVEERMQEILHTTVAPTEANARAKMLIYLLENKLITV